MKAGCWDKDRASVKAAGGENRDFFIVNPAAACSNLARTADLF